MTAAHIHYYVLIGRQRVHLWNRLWRSHHFSYLYQPWTPMLWKSRIAQNTQTLRFVLCNIVFPGERSVGAYSCLLLLRHGTSQVTPHSPHRLLFCYLRDTPPYFAPSCTQHVDRTSAPRTRLAHRHWMAQPTLRLCHYVGCPCIYLWPIRSFIHLVTLPVQCLEQLREAVLLAIHKPVTSMRLFACFLLYCLLKIGNILNSRS
jgi:hypothetical protein